MSILGLFFAAALTIFGIAAMVLDLFGLLFMTFRYCTGLLNLTINQNNSQLESDWNLEDTLL